MAEYPRYQSFEIAQAPSTKQESIDDLYNRVMRSNNHNPPTASIERKGAVGLMVLPKSWTPGPAQSGVRGADYFISYHPPESSDVLISLAYDGMRQDKSTAGSFVQSVDKRAAVKTPDLSRDEISHLSNVFGQKADPNTFKMDSAKVETYDGRQVLVTTGTYVKTNVRETSVYVDADRTGSVIQVISLQTPAADYNKYDPQFKDMLKKLLWNPGH